MTLERLDEPLLRFKDSTSTYCKDGLCETGPYDSIKEGHKNKITLGIIGLKAVVEKTMEWIDLCNNAIESKPHGTKEEINKELFPDFPGCDYAFETRLVIEKRFVQYIPISDFYKLNRQDNIKYTQELLSLFKDKMKLMLEVNQYTEPDVILCVLTEEMYELGHSAGDYHRRIQKKKKIVDLRQMNLFKDIDNFSENDFSYDEDEPFHINFRSMLKKIAMDIRIPIQIIREATFDPNDKSTQNAATKAWNFCTGIYYKSGKHPWILNDIDDRTCYLGVSFFHKKGIDFDDIYTSMAHMFTNDFEDIILRGDKVEYDQALRMPYLTYDQSKNLLISALMVFEKIRRMKPQRLVIHKTSEFRKDEIKGLSEVLEESGIFYDLITLRKSSLRLLRYGSMPVPRGSMFSMDKNTYFLYTKGFIPELRTYPGVHVPAPFEIRKARGDSSYKEICKEILALTKLNWNTADFCSGLPITIGFSRNVGQVLKVFDENDCQEPERGYRFYM